MQTQLPHADRALAPLPTSLAALTFAFDAFPLGVMIFDVSLRLRYQNGPAEGLIAADADLSASLTREIHDSRFEDWNANLESAWSNAGPRRFDSLTLRQADGGPRHVNILMTTLTDPAEAAARYGLLLLEDISARITMEQRLAVSERLAAVGKLCASVAHELNNPLDGVLRYLNLAQRLADETPAGNLPEYVRSAREGCQRLAHIVRTLLDFSRNSPPPLADQTLARLIDEAVRTFAARAAERNVSIVCRYPQADVPAIGGINLYQVFCNVIKNAIDAMPSGGALTISADANPGEITITFADSGTGLPPEADRLFQPFFTTKPPGQGTGLGLAVCREIVERLGGTITAANRPDGRGAIFTVRIPQSASTPIRRRPAPRIARVAPGDPTHVRNSGR